MESLVYPKIKLELWCERYGLKPTEKPCAKCGNIQKTTTPWASKKYRGLESPPHECGHNFTHSTCTPIDKKEKNEWLKILDFLKVENEE